MSSHMRHWGVSEWERAARAAGFQPAEMAASCKVSLRLLELHFQEKFQTTPSTWLRLLQCRLAKELLEEGFASKAVAYELGFSSPSHFCREFKKVYGCSPLKFRTGKGAGDLSSGKISLIDNQLPL